MDNQPGRRSSPTDIRANLGERGLSHGFSRPQRFGESAYLVVAQLGRLGQPSFASDERCLRPAAALRP
jgi:hypothetical protein